MYNDQNNVILTTLNFKWAQKRKNTITAWIRIIVF